MRRTVDPRMARAKTKFVVSPVLDPDDIDEDDSLTKNAAKATKPSTSNAWNTHDQAWDVPELITMPPKLPNLQLKNVAAVHGVFQHLARLHGGKDLESNQEIERTRVSSSAQKYQTIGQKQQWRRQRSQRPRSGQIVCPVADQKDGNDSSFASSGEPVDSTGDEIIDISSLSRSFSTRSDSFTSYETEFSPLPQSESEPPKQRFVIARHKKITFIAKLYLPGQRNPLYLGRFKSEEAARAACESAFTVITTPRM